MCRAGDRADGEEQVQQHRVRHQVLHLTARISGRDEHVRAAQEQ